MFKQIGDLRVHYQVRGRGKPLVLVHGGQCRLESWRDMVPSLAKAFRVYAYDLRAHGQTITPSEPPQSQGLWAEDLYRLLKSLRLPRVSVVGWSMGAAIALTFAVRYPKMLNNLILVGASSPLIPPTDRSGFEARRRLLESGASGEEIVSKTFEFTRKAFGPYSINENPQGVEKLKQDLLLFYSKPGKQIMEITRAARADIGPKLHTIKCPTLIIVGDADSRTPMTMAESLNSVIPNSYMKVIPDCGHFYPYENPRFTSQVISNFVKTFK
jgi:pimeloyl-ACP methyl ester carboxylesterase